MNVIRVAREELEGLVDRARGRVGNGHDEGPDERLLVAGGVGLGAAAMYFFDRRSGARRRALVRDQVVRSAHQTKDALEAITEDASNKARGLAAETAALVRSDDVDDEVIVERVRAELGYLASHPSSIEVDAANGRVTLRGPVLADEVNRLVRGVARVRGVKDVDNHLDVYDERRDVPGLQGRGKVPRRMRRERWSPTTRALAFLAGAGATYYALSRRMPRRVPMALVAGAMASRALFNRPVKRLVGIGAGRRAINLQKSINIDAPVDEVFGYWREFQNFPRFMTHVRDVKPVGGDRWRWIVEGPGGVPVKFDAVVSAYRENELIGWKTVEGSAIAHSGLVRFESKRRGGTTVHLHVTYNPVAGAVGHTVARLLGSDPKKRMDDDVVRMKSLIETGKPPADAARPAM